jgi:hypothetical protein
MRLTAFLAVLLLAGIAALASREIALRRRADEIYRRAERFYQAGDFEKSIVCCNAALRGMPSHAPTRALKTELELILGQGKASLTPPVDYSRYMRGASLADIDAAYGRGVRAFNLGERGRAEHEFSRILDYGKWFPDEESLRTRLQQARGMLDRLRVQD